MRCLMRLLSIPAIALALALGGCVYGGPGWHHGGGYYGQRGASHYQSYQGSGQYGHYNGHNDNYRGSGAYQGSQYMRGYGN